MQFPLDFNLVLQRIRKWRFSDACSGIDKATGNRRIITEMKNDVNPHKLKPFGNSSFFFS